MRGYQKSDHDLTVIKSKCLQSMYPNYEKLRKIYSSVDNSGYLLLFEKIKLLKKDIGNF